MKSEINMEAGEVIWIRQAVILDHRGGVGGAGRGDAEM